ncbi:MAG: hypothetical protein SNJ77_05050 [Cytophagales bacterium]
MKYIVNLLAILSISSHVFGQLSGNKVSFSGAGRAFLNQSDLMGEAVESDTTNPRSANGGHTLIDVGINIKPNEKTLLHTTLRARNEFGGFYGSGAQVRVRQIYLQTLIAKKVSFKIGDLDLKQNQHTLWNNIQDGVVNESKAFSNLRDVVNYENFYFNQPTWRLKAAQFSSAWRIGKWIDTLQANSFIASLRNAGVNPARFNAGASVGVKNNQYFNFNLHHNHTFEAQATSLSTEKTSNFVNAYDLTLSLPTSSGAFSLVNQLAVSNFKHHNIDKTELNGYALDLGLKWESMKKTWTNQLSFKQNHHQFISAGAQTRRWNPQLNNELFSKMGNDNQTRASNLWDFNRDYQLFNRMISPELMAYNPIYSLVLPFEDATPNRQGLVFESVYQSKSEVLNFFSKSAVLNNFVGEGTELQKQFYYVKSGLKLSINKWLKTEKDFAVLLGHKFESSNRGGRDFEKINFQTQFFEAGLDYEFLKNFSLNGGMKYLNAQGNELIAIRDVNNLVNNYVPFSANHQEIIYAIGFQYSFSPKTVFAIQNHLNSIESSGKKMQLNQLFLLFNLTL